MTSSKCGHVGSRFQATVTQEASTNALLSTSGHQGSQVGCLPNRKHACLKASAPFWDMDLRDSINIASPSPNSCYRVALEARHAFCLPETLSV